MRKLVTLRTIDLISPIEGADAIEVATIGGWNVVVKKGDFRPDDECVYFEIDSFLPTGNPAWQFLVDKSSREFEGVVGHRLRTIKLRGQVSQGFIVSLHALPEVVATIGMLPRDQAREMDFADLLGVKKFEQPLPAELAGQAEGLFPSFIRKTDQERCQNLVGEIFGYEDTKVLIEGMVPEQADPEAVASGKLVIEDGKVYSIRKAKASLDDEYEITLKLDGSSMTVFARQHEGVTEGGVCSRNLQLKVNEENAHNTFVKLATDSGLLKALESMSIEGYGDYAVQGELMGPGIQGNREGLTKHELYIFEVQRLTTGENLTPDERGNFMEWLELNTATDMTLVRHAPILAYSAKLFDTLGIKDVQGLLRFAEGKSLVHAVREGLVFKRRDGKFSFKVISNVFLAKEKD